MDHDPKRSGGWIPFCGRVTMATTPDRGSSRSEILHMSIMHQVCMRNLDHDVETSNRWSKRINFFGFLLLVTTLDHNVEIQAAYLSLIFQKTPFLLGHTRTRFRGCTGLGVGATCLGKLGTFDCVFSCG